jgi:hypothetical protein
MVMYISLCFLAKLATSNSVKQSKKKQLLSLNYRKKSNRMEFVLHACSRVMKVTKYMNFTARLHSDATVVIHDFHLVVNSPQIKNIQMIWTSTIRRFSIFIATAI